MPKVLSYRWPAFGDPTHKPLVYTPSFMDLIANKQNDLEEAKQRVFIIDREYKYIPSREYLEAFTNYLKQKQNGNKNRQKDSSKEST